MIYTNWNEISTNIIDNLIASIFSLLLIIYVKLITQKITRENCIGIGDAKLFSIGALWIGSNGIILGFILSFISAGIFSFLLAINKKLNRYQPFAFAPFISSSIFLVWILGEDWWKESWMSLWGL